MSNIRMEFYSVSLQRTVSVWIILPNDLLPAMTEGNEHYARPMKTLIVNEIKSLKPGTDNGVADYDYYAGTFGDLQQLGESENNPEYLIHKLKGQYPRD